MNPPPPKSPYSGVLHQVPGSPSSALQREICQSDDDLAIVLASALQAHAAQPPKSPPAINKALQGNLTEFAAWDLGDQYWLLYDREMSWATNAVSPWKASSSDGLDILALTGETNFALLVVEIKSSREHGANLVTGGNSSLQSDFAGLFAGSVQNRLQISLGTVLCGLRFQGRRDLEEQVKTLVGESPSDSPGVNLLGVLFCKQGSTTDVEKRERAFERLKSILLTSGWESAQISFRSVELGNFQQFLDRTVTEATR